MGTAQSGVSLSCTIPEIALNWLTEQLDQRRLEFIFIRKSRNLSKENFKLRTSEKL